MAPMQVSTTLSAESTPVHITESKRPVDPGPSDGIPRNLAPSSHEDTIVIIILAVASLILFAAGIHTYKLLNHVSIETNGHTVEYSDHNTDHDDDDDDEELRDLESNGYEPGSKVELCTARAVRIRPLASTSMSDVRSGGRGQWPLGLKSSSSVRDVSTLPDLYTAQAVLAPRRESMGEEGMGAKLEVVAEQREKMEPAKTAPESKGLRKALKKRISTHRFQGGGMRELVRSLGF